MSTATKGLPQVTPLQVAQDLAVLEAAQIPSKECAQRNKLDHYAIIKFPLTTESDGKTDFSVDVKLTSTSSNRLERNSLIVICPKSVSCSDVMGRGRHVWLAPTYDALDVAK